MNDQNELEAVVKEWLDEIKPVPPRDPQMVSCGRAQFLGKAVSAHEPPRQKGWMSIFRKERYAMNALISTFIVAGLLFGGGATVSAAQDNLPNEPFYIIKTWTEDLSLQFRNNQEDKVDRLMELSQIRIQEMIRLAEAGESIPDQVRLRLEQHINQALQLCKNMDDATLEHALLQIHDRLRDQDRDMEQLLLHTQDQLTLQTQTRIMLQERLRLVEEGLLSHEIFRYRMQNGFHFGKDDKLTPPVQNGNGQQNNRSTATSSGPNTDPGGPNSDSGGSNTNPGGPNTDPGGSNPDPGGRNTDILGPNTNPGGSNANPGGNTNDSGTGSGSGFGPGG